MSNIFFTFKTLLAARDAVICGDTANATRLLDELIADNGAAATLMELWAEHESRRDDCDNAADAALQSLGAHHA